MEDKTKKDAEQEAIAAFAADLEELQKKHNLRVVPVARLEVQYIDPPKPVLDPI